ncbi:rhomboid family intramembrane serine protease [Lacinutrix mariniflava]|uniref:rhomboid family intramembrane serine protease n=1 Tax=Lacinutrix mariniflava TaxID=342955 RepID=UPI0006E17671|nr:rhomboid family intramembrane serine protease [Lacinutrix mariniflava]
MGNLNVVTIVLIVVNVLFSIKGFKDFSFFEKYKFNVGAIKRGEKIRMLTSGFLHVNPQHLLFNMVTLYFFAYIVIAKLGEVQFVIIYLASLVAGSLLSLAFNKNNYHYSAVGASGAVMGIIYSAILLEPYYLKIYGIIPGWLFGIGYLLYSIYGMKNKTDNIGHDAHFGGAVGGYVITLICAPSLIQTDLTMVLVLALPIVLLFVMKKLGKI